MSNVNQFNESVSFYHGGFGEFLNSKGLLIGVPLVWGITVFEIAGGATMALGFY